jgi:cytochrome c biogenesis protein
MKNIFKEIWALLCSVKLALFTFIILAITSIVGTIIPQGEQFSLYIQKYGAGVAKLFFIFNVPDMYNAFWFLSLLVLFCMNITACSIDRLPRVWRIFKQDNLQMKRDRLEKMQQGCLFSAAGSIQQEAGAISERLNQLRWNPKQSNSENGSILLFAQKGAWSRFGVYVVHLSILVIFIGAIIGSIFGEKGSVMLPEGSFTDRIYLFDGQNSQLPIGFQVRCDRFGLEYYSNGRTPKEYWSDLVVLQDGKEILSKTIEVNDPLKYGGFTFYQSSYQAYDGQYFVVIKNLNSGDSKSFTMPFGKEIKWRGEGVSFGITNTSKGFQGGFPRYKIWFSDGIDEPLQFWVEDNKEQTVDRQGTDYQFLIKQRYATGLQVAKDPGVWWVYIGFTLMLMGLIVVFFLSHRRLWVLVHEEGGVTNILVSGTSNKNRVGFETTFNNIVKALSANLNKLDRRTDS